MAAENLGPLSKEEIMAACKTPDPSTEEFIFQQTMYRIKDPKKSLEFYTGVLGMRLFKDLHFPEYKATLELTHNWGTEKDDTKYHNGNSDPRGYGHIGIMVPDVEKACTRFEEQGVEFTKKPNDGKMKGLAFIKDPDGYLIEILSAHNMKKSL